MTLVGEKLKPLLSKPVFRAEEARQMGIHPALLHYYIEKGVFERLDRGIYQPKGVELKVPSPWEEMALIASTIPNGIVCLQTALIYYELSEDFVREYWIAIPHSQRAPRRKHTKIVRMRNIDLGKTAIELGKFKIAIFDPERTIVDTFRYLGREEAIKSLKLYLHSKKIRPDLKKLKAYARVLRVHLEPYILAIMI